MNRVLFSMGFIFSLLFGSFLAFGDDDDECIYAGDIDLNNYEEQCNTFESFDTKQKI